MTVFLCQFVKSTSVQKQILLREQCDVMQNYLILDPKKDIICSHVALENSVRDKSEQCTNHHQNWLLRGEFQLLYLQN